jgi:hypothetical protein
MGQRKQKEKVARILNSDYYGEITIMDGRKFYLYAKEMIPNFVEDIVDEFDCDTEREVVQRLLAVPPLYDICDNSHAAIARQMNICRMTVRKISNRLKNVIWKRMGATLAVPNNN